MQSIYIHIPFCLKKCSYCDFYSVTDLKFINQYVEILLTEIETYKKYKNQEIKTLYFGGGTPSLLSPDQLSLIINKLKEIFVFAKDLEFTLEVNPETYTEEKFIEFGKLGVNRISIGIQSFEDHELKSLGRIHNSNKAKQALEGIRKLFKNFSIDLMYGLPGQTIEQANKNLEIAISYKPKHISWYELTPVLSDKNDLYQAGKVCLEQHGYKQYEISNYSLPGYESKHNLAYWSDESYLGLGASAHSYDNQQKLRWANTAHLEKYLKKDFIESTEPAKDFDIIMMGLRKNDGISKLLLKNHNIEKLIADKLIEENQDNIRFTEKGRLLANQVLLKLI